MRTCQRASQAFLYGDGATAKVLSKEAKRLAEEYTRLNRMAMIALAHERSKLNPISTLDLHGFHVQEALELLGRRIHACQRSRIPRLRIITGAGTHSKKGTSTLLPAIMDVLQGGDVVISNSTRVIEVKPAYVVVKVLMQPYVN